MLSSNRMAELAKPQTSSSLANGFAAIVLLQVTLECSSGSNVGKMMDCREQQLLMTAACQRKLILNMRGRYSLPCVGLLSSPMMFSITPQASLSTA